MQIIELNREKAPIFTYDKCVKCGQKFVLNKYLVQHGLYLFHLTCFKKYSEEQIMKHEEDIEEMKTMIEGLKLYNKEMICETLLKEKYG